MNSHQFVIATLHQFFLTGSKFECYFSLWSDEIDGLPSGPIRHKPLMQAG